MKKNKKHLIIFILMAIIKSFTLFIYLKKQGLQMCGQFSSK